MSGKDKVRKFLEDNFNLSAFKIQDMPLFPNGVRLVDKENNAIVVYYDFLHDEVKYFFEEVK